MNELLAQLLTAHNLVELINWLFGAGGVGVVLSLYAEHSAWFKSPDRKSGEKVQMLLVISIIMGVLWSFISFGGPPVGTLEWREFIFAVFRYSVGMTVASQAYHRIFGDAGTNPTIDDLAKGIMETLGGKPPNYQFAGGSTGGIPATSQTPQGGGSMDTGQSVPVNMVEGAGDPDERAAFNRRLGLGVPKTDD